MLRLLCVFSEVGQQCVMRSDTVFYFGEYICSQTSSFLAESSGARTWMDINFGEALPEEHEVLVDMDFGIADPGLDVNGWADDSGCYLVCLFVIVLHFIKLLLIRDGFWWMFSNAGA